MKKYCLVAHNAVGAVFPEIPRCFGGIETGAWTLARGLAVLPSREVTLHVLHTRRLPRMQAEGVQLSCRVEPFREIRRAVSTSAGLRSPFRFFRPSMLWQMPLLAMTWPFRERDLPPFSVEPELAKLDCDAYVAFGISPDSARVVATARATQRPVVVSLQSNADIPDCPLNENAGVPDWQMRMFREATAFVCQSDWQQQRLLEITGRQSVLLPNPIGPEFLTPARQSREHVLWIGRADTFHKRPLLALEIARELPDVPFLFVMNPLDPLTQEKVESTKPDNVTIIPQIRFPEMPELFSRSKLFLSTGAKEQEGFPNVFLQAAATGTPIVSMHDFDSFLTRTTAGVVTGEDPATAAEAIRRLLENPGESVDFQKVETELRARYGINEVCRQLDELLTRLLQEFPNA